MKNDILFKKLSSRLDELSKFAKLDDEKSIPSLIKEKGFSRREFMAWAAAMTSMLMLPANFTPLVAKAAEISDRLPLIWLHMAECTGCSESLLRSASPSIDSLIFDYISLEYHETIIVEKQVKNNFYCECIDIPPSKTPYNIQTHFRALIIWDIVQVQSAPGLIDI